MRQSQASVPLLQPCGLRNGPPIWVLGGAEAGARAHCRSSEQRAYRNKSPPQRATGWWAWVPPLNLKVSITTTLLKKVTVQCKGGGQNVSTSTSISLGGGYFTVCRAPEGHKRTPAHQLICHKSTNNCDSSVGSHKGAIGPLLLKRSGLAALGCCCRLADCLWHGSHDGVHVHKCGKDGIQALLGVAGGRRPGAKVWAKVRGTIACSLSHVVGGAEYCVKNTARGLGLSGLL